MDPNDDSSHSDIPLIGDDTIPLPTSEQLEPIDIFTTSTNIHLQPQISNTHKMHSAPIASPRPPTNALLLPSSATVQDIQTMKRKPERGNRNRISKKKPNFRRRQKSLFEDANSWSSTPAYRARTMKRLRRQLSVIEGYSVG